MTEFRTPERSISASIILRVNRRLDVPAVVGWLARRERWVLLLVDGKRTLADLAHLTHRSELDVAHTLARLLQQGYIEQVSAAENDPQSHRTPL